jgi:hypothetical protein
MSDTAVAGYELWDTESRNLLDDFDTEAEALEAVRALIALNGLHCTQALALTRVWSDGRMSTVATGDALAVLAETPRPSPAGSRPD